MIQDNLNQTSRTHGEHTSVTTSTSDLSVIFHKIIKSHTVTPNGRNVIHVDSADIMRDDVVSYLESFALSDTSDIFILEVHLSPGAFVMDVADRLRPLAQLFQIEPRDIAVLAADERDILLSAIA